MFKMFFMRLERRLAVTLGIVLSCVGLLYFLFDVKTNSGSATVLESFQLSYVDTDTLEQADTMEEQWQLLDSMPLFAPTKWNASQKLLEDHFNKIEPHFAYYEPDIQLEQFFEITNWKLPSRNTVIKEAHELFLLRNRYFLDHFDKLHGAALPLSATNPRACRVVVTVPDGSRTTKLVPYTSTEAQSINEPLNPVDCMVNYQSGMQEVLGSLVVSTSGVIDFDTFFESWIRLNFIAEFADRSGLYAIRIYPPLN